MAKSIHMEDFKTVSYFNIDFIHKATKGIIPEAMRQNNYTSMVHGFTSGYRGGCFFQRNYSSKLKPDEAKIVRNAMMEDVSKGHCAGP